MHDLIPEIGISLVAAAIIGYLFHILKQPLILSYIIAGAIIGPSIGFGLVYNPESIEVISELGLILLLFIIGLELNLNKLKSAGKELVFVGIGQFILCVLIGLGFFLLLGYELGPVNIDALYLAIFCALSSTAIVVKLLYDKFELDTIPGRITLGVLIFQDIWAILVLALQPNFTDPQILVMLTAVGKSVFLLAIGFLCSKYILNRVFDKISKTPELVVAISISWCAFMAGLSAYIGLSMEMGALIAGVAISSFPFGVHIIAKVLPLRDFFLTLFFLSIGMKIPVPDLSVISAASLIVLLVFISRFLSVYPVLSLNGRGRRTCFIVSLNLSQISEFSLVIAALGVGYGHISDNLLTVITYAMAFTSVITSYLIKSNHEIFLAFDKFLSGIGLSSSRQEQINAEGQDHYPIVLLGCHRGGMAFIDKLNQNSPQKLKQLLVIDYNLEILKELKDKGINGVFGDISSMDTLEHAHISEAKIILCTIPDMLLKGTSNLNIVRTCRALAPNATIIATADSTNQINALKASGANEVILPYMLMSDQLLEFTSLV